MPNVDDANVKLLYAADKNTTFAIDDIKLGADFDVLLDVEIGSNLNQIATAFDARAGVRNLTQSKNVAVAEKLNGSLTSSATPLQATVRLPVTGWGGNAAVGDVLQVVASYTVKAGVRRDISMVESPTFVVSE
jgi:hypothetical protein